MKKNYLALITMIFLCAFTQCTQQKITETEVNFSREAIISEADRYLQQPPVPITSFSSERSAGSIHDFYSEGDYWWPNPEDMEGPYIRKDGQTNPANFTAHRESMRDLSRWIAALTAAYQLTEDEKYAQKALEHLRAWFLNKQTMMNPSLLYAQAIKGKVTGRGIGIIDTIHLIEVAKSVQVLEKLGFLTGTDLAGLKNWFDQYVTWLTTHSYGIDERDHGNNHSTWWAAQAAAFAKLTGREEVLVLCREQFKKLLSAQMDETGGFPEELGRTKPFNYTLFNIEGYAVLAYFASTSDDDLWNYETKDGSLRKAIDFISPFLLDKNSWPYTPDVQHFDEIPIQSAFLLFASQVYQNDQYLETWKKLPLERKSKEVDRNFPIRQLVLW